jgi:phosphatidylinositol glycan class V
VGFLRYWTLSNLPLFLIAAPMLYTLIDSARIVLNGQMTEGTARINIKQKPSKSGAVPHSNVLTDAILIRLALPQLALACGALSSFHVQVITRLSSGYPLWYVVLARDVMDDKRTAQWTVRWMVMYALIQAVLFVNFLPPA